MKIKKFFKAVLIFILVILLAALAYVAYVFISFDRIEDNVALTADTPVSGTSLSAALPTDSPLSALSANIGFGAYSADFDFFMDGGTQSWAWSKDAVVNHVTNEANALAAEDADFILLQEVDTDGTRSYHVNEYDIVRSCLPDYESVLACNYHSPFLLYPICQPHGANTSNLVTLSRVAKSTSNIRRSLPVSETLSRLVDLDRCYTVSRFDVENGKELVIINIHATAYGAGASVRDAQTSMLFNEMQTEYAKGNYVLVGGDFNHDMTGDSDVRFGNSVTGRQVSFPFENVPSGFTVVVKALADAGTLDCAATCRSCDHAYDETSTRWILDTFITSDNISVESYTTVDLKFSWADHNPIKITFSLIGQ